jgi:hypothetical protein
MSSNEKFERAFAAFLHEEDSRLAALYRKLPQTEPDPRLDAAVRAMAHRAPNPELVATPPASASQRRRGRWLSALGAAAGVVLAAGIAFRLGPSWHGERGETGATANDVIDVRPVEAPSAGAPPLSPAPPPQGESETGPAMRAAQSVPGKLQTQAAAEAPKPATPATVREKAAKFEDSAENRPVPEAAGTLGKAAEKPAPAGKPQPEAFPASARKRAPEIDAVERKEIMATGAWQNLHDRDTGAAAGKGPAQPSYDEKDAAVHAETAVPARQDEVRGTAPAAAPAAPPAAPASPQAAPGAAADHATPPPGASAPASAAALKPDIREGVKQEEHAAPPAFDKTAQQKPNEKYRSKDPNANLYPEHWLQNIRMMLRDGNRDDALRSLSEFRRMYPDYRLPDDLRDLR